MSDETVIPAAEPDPTLVPEAQLDPASTPAPEGDNPLATEPEAEPEAKQKKSAVAQLQGRVGHLTRTLHERDAEAAELRKQNEALQALLNGNAGPTAPTQPPPAQTPPVGAPQPGTPEFERYVETVADQRSRDRAYTDEANRVNAQGKAAHGQAWEDTLSILGSMGVLSRNFNEAVFASGDPVGVLTTLGEDLDEAARIANLAPVRMAAELTKLAMSKPAGTAAQPVPTSRAPAPIRPVGSAVSPNVDMDQLSKGNDMAAYVAARKAQGSPFAR